MDDATPRCVAWLNDAYALENALVPILENHARDAKDDPQAHDRIERHADQTRRHAELVKGCVERLNGRTSAVKTGLASVVGSIQSISTGIFQDELVKNGLSDYAAEHFEIACYRALVAGANAIGDTQIAEVCREILRDEEEMAHWLEQQLPTLVNKALATPS